MSPDIQDMQDDQSNQFNDTNSPWTECFQTNPVHREGYYDNESPEKDEATSPTWQALSAIYDATERE